MVIYAHNLLMHDTYVKKSTYSQSYINGFAFIFLHKKRSGSLPDLIYWVSWDQTPNALRALISRDATISKMILLQILLQIDVFNGILFLKNSKKLQLILLQKIIILKLTIPYNPKTYSLFFHVSSLVGACKYPLWF